MPCVFALKARAGTEPHPLSINSIETDWLLGWFRASGRPDCRRPADGAGGLSFPALACRDCAEAVGRPRSNFQARCRWTGAPCARPMGRRAELGCARFIQPRRAETDWEPGLVTTERLRSGHGLPLMGDRGPTNEAFPIQAHGSTLEEWLWSKRPYGPEGTVAMVARTSVGPVCRKEF